MAKYLYNGVPLPALPDYETEVNQFALIIYNSTYETYFFGANTFAFEAIESIKYIAGYIPKVEYKLVDGVWEESNTAFIGRAIWANHDVYYSDSDANAGQVALAASEPIPILAPTIDPLSLFLGWKAGNWVARQRGKVKQPVAYLYNGVRLPGLPEWDKTVYPYAAIYLWELTNTYFLRCLATDAQYKWTGEELYFSASKGLSCTAEDGATWSEFEEKGDGYAWIPVHKGENAALPSQLVWSNFDIEHDGTLYLAASDPIPVYE